MLEEVAGVGQSLTPVGMPGLTDVLEALPEPALVTGPDGELLRSNTAAVRVLRLRPADEGRLLTDVIRPLASGDPTGMGEFEQHLVSAEGETVLGVRFELEGTPVSGVWSVAPLQCHVGKTTYRLHRLQLQRHEGADKPTMDFLANVTHELRTPLSALVATTEVMLQDYQTIPVPELGQMIALLHRNTRRLESLVSNLLDAASLQSGKFQLRKSTASPHSLIRDATDFVQPLLLAKNQKLDVRMLGSAPALVVDARRIVGVLVNLLSNASRYGPSKEPIQLLVSGEGTIVRFTVRQRGPGIPKEEQALLFDRFYRASTGESVQGGTGLGLAIVKEIVEMHGGNVGVASKPGKATAFWFTLPVKGDPS